MDSDDSALPVNNIAEVSIPKRKLSSAHTSPLGVFYMFISTLGFTVMTFAMKLMYQSCNLGPFEGVYLRGSSMVVLNIVFAIVNRLDITKIPPSIEPTLWLRTLFGTVGICLNFVGSNLLPISIHNSLFYLYPLLTSLGGYIFIKERLNKLEIVGTFASFAGVLCIIISSRSEGSALKDIELYKYSIPLASACTSTVVFLVTRKMGVDVHYIINPTWFGVVQSLLVTPIWLVMRSNSMLAYNVNGWAGLYIVVMCVGGWIGQIFMNQSLQIEKAGRVAAVGFLQVPLLFLCDLLYFKLNITWVTIFGSLLIISCSFITGMLRLLNIIE